ncbi:MAG: hypothetical protein WD894_20900 [Pirellulales bacterium]
MLRANSDAMVILRGMAGAVIGAVLGWFAVGWLFDQGFYGLALPGALVGLACGAISGGVSRANAILCAALAAVLGIVLEWWHFPFVADQSFSFFVTHLQELRGITWLMLVLGAVFAFWFGRGRSRFAR